MTKVHLTVVREAYGAVIDFLHSSGAVEVEPAEVAEGDQYRPDSKAEYWHASVKFAIDLLNAFVEPERKTLAQKLQGSRTEIDEKGIHRLLQEFDYKRTVVDLENLDKDYNAIKNRIAQNEKEKRQAMEWRGLPEIGDLDRRYVSFRIGTVPVTRFQEFRDAWSALKVTDLIRISESNKEVRVVLGFAQDVADDVPALFETYDFKESGIEFDRDLSLDRKVQRLEEEITEDTRKLQEAGERIRGYGTHLKDLEVLYDHLTWKKDQDEVSKKASTTRRTVSLVGWVPGHRLQEIKDGINAITSQYAIEDVEVAEDEDVPVVLKNPKAITPFESVTEIYGAPQYDEPDPTAYLAPFFILYFGLCLTDAGYGLLLTLLAYAAIRFMKPKGGARKLMVLMMMGGVATFIAGALFGGWFGIVLNDLPEGPVKDAALALRLIDPVENPMGVLILSFILGWIQMIVGNLVNMVWKIRHGAAKEGVLTSGMWAVYLMAIGFWIATMAGALPEGMKTPALYAVLGVTVLMVLTQGYEKKNPVMKVLSGVSSLYGLVGYLSDILSYSRLLALGLSTGIIAMVVNLVADLFGGMVPYVGWLVWLLIIVGGHMFNLAINVLGAFIHSGRLQYVEYFPKFLVGGGRKFKPLVKEAKYITMP